MQRLFLLPFLALLLSAPTMRAAPPDAAPEVEYVRDPKHGEVIHIRNLAALRPAEEKLRERVAQGLPAVSPYSLMEAPAAPRDPAGVAQEFLAAHASAFGLNDHDFELLGSTPDRIGMTHLRFRQVYQCVPLYGVDVAVHVGRNNQVTSAHGSPARVTDMPTLPVLTQEKAQGIALAFWQAEHRQKEPAPTKVYGLYVFAPTALGRPEGTNSTPALVWAVDVAPDDCQREFLAIRFLVDAATGAIRHEIEMHAGDQPLNRRVADCSYLPYTSFCESQYITSPGEPGYPYTFGRREGSSPRGPNPLPAFLGSLDTDTLYDYFENVDRYYWEKFGRDGANMQGGVRLADPTLTGGQTHIDASPVNAGACPNAAFMFDTGNLLFCRGTVTLDVVGHEYAHAVNFYSLQGQGPMGRTGESRALDESQADFFGEMLERFVTGTMDWVNGKQAWPTAARNLADPTRRAIDPDLGVSGTYPDRYYSGGYYCGSLPGSNASYINMMVADKAEYLISEGGTFNGCSIAGLGSAKAEQIVYRASTLHYAVNETFNMAYQSILDACAELYSPADCDQVRRALQAVELDQAGLCSGLPPRPPQALDVEGW